MEATANPQPISLNRTSLLELPTEITLNILRNLLRSPTDLEFINLGDGKFYQ